MTLGSASGSGPIGHPATVALDSRGRFYVASARQDGRILVFDRSGRFLESIGRKGSRPGEFEGIVHLQVSRGDTLHVFEAGNQRHTVLSPSRRLVRTSRVPGRVYGALVEGNGSVLVQSPVPTPARVGLPVHLIGKDGEILRSFAGGRGAYDRENPDHHFRPLARAGRDHLWLAHLNRYEVELWDVEGRLLRTLVRDAAWFRPWDRPAPGAPFAARPKPAIVSIREDPQGRLWIVASVADTNWKKGRVGHGGGRPVEEMTRRFDTVVEVIDPETGHLLASARDPGIPPTFITADLVFRPVESRDGGARIEVWQVRLTSLSRRKVP